MEPLVLSDKSVFPTDEVIFSIIGKNQEHWKKLMNTVHDKFPDASGQWNYYNDGKNWLFKMTVKKKTLFWIAVHRDTFRITFYFSDKAEPLIDQSGLPEALIHEFKTGKHYGKIRALSIKVNQPEDVENAVKLMDIRIKVA
jgi:hypothetical protein